MIVKQAHVFKNKVLSITYFTILSCFSVISIYFAFASVFGGLDIRASTWALSLDIVIWIAFTFDYLYRLYQAENKREFIKQNIWDSLAIIPVPLLNIFWSNGIINVLRLLRVAAFIDELRDGFNALTVYKEVGYAFYFFGLVIVGSSFGIYFAEKTAGTVSTVGDAVWWSFVTSSTVGYGDISPKTILGRVIAVFLMILGTSLLNILTTTLAFHFIEMSKKRDREEELKGDLNHDGMITIDVSGLSEREIKALLGYVKLLKAN